MKKTQFKYLIILLLFLWQNRLSAQNIDSLFTLITESETVEQEQAFYREMYNSLFKLKDPPTAIEKLKTSLPNSTGKAIYYNYEALSSFSWRTNEMDQAVEYARKMLIAAGDDTEKQLTAYYILSHKFSYNNQLDSVLYYTTIQEELAKQTNSKQIWKAYLERAFVYESFGEKEKFIADLDQVIDFFRKNPNHKQKGFSLYRIADHFYQAEDLENFNKYGVDFFEYFKGKTPVVPKGHLPIDQLIFQDGPDVAIAKLKESIEVRGNEQLIKITAKQLLAKAYSKKNEPEKGIAVLKEIIKEDSTKMIQKDLVITYLLLGNLYEQNGQFQKANEQMKLFVKHNDLLQSELREQEFVKMEVQFDTERKENELALSQVKLQKANRERFALFGGMGALLLLAGLLSYLYRTRSKANKLLNEKNEIISENLAEKEVLLREIHHRVKNNLQVISSLLNLQSKHVDDPAAQKAMEEGRNRVRSMALIHQNLYQEEDLVGVNAKEYLEKLTDSLVQNYKLSSSEIAVKNDIEDITLDVDIMIPLGLIINELISNSLKYAFSQDRPGEISVSLKQKEQSLHLQVRDDGIGLPENFSMEQETSLGYKIIRAFAKKLQATLKVGNQEGTQIDMIFPLKQIA